MRLQSALVVIVGLPAVLAALTRVPAPGEVVPLPAIGLPLPRIDFPLAPIGRPPATDTRIRGGDRHPPRPIENPHQPTVVYFFPAYGWPYPQPAQTSTPTHGVPDESATGRESEPLTGRVQLDVQPTRDLEIYAGGYYVGTLDDLGGHLELEAGLHSIEMRATGHETLQLDVRITAGRSITYRGALTPFDETSAPDPVVHPSADVAPATPRTFYLIPGCYMGNVPPKDANLPATCDLSRLLTFVK